MNWLDKLERKFGKYAIHNLMYYIIILYILGLVIQMVNPSLYTQWLGLDAEAILHGQIWRIVTFIIQPPNASFLFMAFALYFYYMVGQALEYMWGAFRFNVYIFGGMIFTVLGALLLYVIYGVNTPISMGGSFSTYYINMTIFLAFAMCYPDMRIMLYFIIPIKMKWMAGIYAALIIYEMIISSWGGRVAIIASVLNFLIFFFTTRNYRSVSPKEVHRKRTYHRQVQQPKGVTRHKCAICGRTELDDPNLEFRFCSKCNGNYEYCQDHLFTHEHVK